MYFICYDMEDNLICLLNDINELAIFLHMPIKEINRKYRNSVTNYIVSIVNDKKYKFYQFI